MHSYIQEGRFCMKKRSSRGNTGENALQEWISDHIRYLVMIILLLLAGVVIATVVGLTGGVRSDRSRRNIPGSGAVVSGAELRESAENTPEEDPQTEESAVSQTESETEAETEKQSESEAETERQTESEAETEKLTESEIEPEKQTESEAETEKLTESEAETEKQSESEAETEKLTESEAGTEKQSGSEAETEKLTESEAETEKQSGNEAETEKQTESEAETEKQSGSEAETEKLTESEVETETQTESEAETEKLSESEAETEKLTESEAETENFTEAESEEDGISARTQTGAEDGIKTGAGPAAAVKEDETEAGTEAENRFLDETETESENVEEWDRESVQDFDPEAPLVGVGAAQNSQQETEEDLSAPDTVDARNTILVSGSSSMGGNSSSVTNRATGVTVTNAGIVLPATLTAPTVPGAENSGLPQETVSSGSSPQASENLPADSSSYGSESGLSSESVLTAPTVQETQAPQTEAPQPTYLTMTGTCYLRSAPDYGDNILGTYQAGTTVLFYGPEEGWYKVEVDGMVGYMGPKFFQ